MARVYKDQDWFGEDDDVALKKAVQNWIDSGKTMTPEILQQMRHAQNAGKWWAKDRNLTGNRNKQGDFIPAHKDLDNVSTDLTNPEVAGDPSIAANAEVFDQQADYKRLKAKELHEARLAKQETKSKSPVLGGDLDYSGQPDLKLNKATTDNLQEALNMANSTKGLEEGAGGDQTRAVEFDPDKPFTESIEMSKTLDQAAMDNKALFETETAMKNQRKLGSSQEALRIQEEEEDEGGFISWLSDFLGSGSGSREKGMLTKKHKSGQVAYGKGRGLYR